MKTGESFWWVVASFALWVVSRYWLHFLLFEVISVVCIIVFFFLWFDTNPRIRAWAKSRGNNAGKK